MLRKQGTGSICNAVVNHDFHQIYHELNQSYHCINVGVLTNPVNQDHDNIININEC